MDDLPACRCGSRNWRLDAELRILLHASSDDPEGPFKRELAADSIHELVFWCTGCGQEARAADSRVMEALWRSHAPERAKILTRVASSPS